MRRPLLRYFGGKWRMAPKIIQMFPKHYCYVEVFGGGGSVLLRKEPSSIEVYNDKWEMVVNLFRMLRDRPKSFAKLIEYTPWSRKEFENCIEIYKSDDDLERARKFFVVAWQNRQHGGRHNGMLPKNWKTTASRIDVMPKCEDLFDIAARLRNVVLECDDYQNVIDRYDREHTLFYLDPPYPGIDGYTYNIDHEEFLSRVVTLKGYVIISSTDNELYDRYLEGWYKLPFTAMSQNNLPKSECLYMNYTLS